MHINAIHYEYDEEWMLWVVKEQVLVTNPNVNEPHDGRYRRLRNQRVFVVLQDYIDSSGQGTELPY